MIDEENYYKMIYQKYVEKQKESGLWIEHEDVFEQMQKSLAANFKMQRNPKEKLKLSDEQLKKNQEYFQKVRSLERLEIKKPEFKKLELREAKTKVYEIIKELLPNKKPIFSDRDIEVYRLLTQYFNKENDFPKDLNKGICLFGGVGTGKTMNMKVFQKFTFENTNKYKIFDMKEIAREVQRNGLDSIENYTRGICCYEDVGFEKQVMHYGSKIDIFEEIVNLFYEKGKIFHITTNLSFNEDCGYGTFAERYDRRIVDRLKEMVNVIGLDGESKRK